MANRPKTLSEFIGQEQIKPLLRAEIKDANTRNRPPRHIGLFGPPGVGKTSLAGVIANETGAQFHTITAGPSWNARAVENFLMSLSVQGYDEQGRPTATAVKHIIFIDEVHELPNTEVWYKPMEDQHIDVGGSESWLPFFSVVAATTDPHKVPKPLRDRMGLQLTLQPYTVEELEKVIAFNQRQMKPELRHEIALRSRGTARIAIEMAESVRINGPGYFDAVGIDRQGLTIQDRAYLDLLRTGKKSLATLAARLGQSEAVVRELIEPYLLRLGLIEITGSGRILAGAGGRGRRAE